MQKGQIFGVEDAFVENPKKDKTTRYFTWKVVRIYCLSDYLGVKIR